MKARALLTLPSRSAVAREQKVVNAPIKANATTPESVPLLEA